jgi:predicted DsbA family dithiol-disulfide isomerase
LDAHRVVHYAKTKTSREMIERIFKAHCCDALDLSEHSVLASLAGGLALTARRNKHFRINQYREEVINMKFTASRLGIGGVPY